MKLTRTPVFLLIWAGLCLSVLFGWLEPFDDALRNLRFSASPRAPSGSVVFLEVDSRSLAQVGVWPWPRSVYADILDRLGELGAAEIALDIDLSTASTEGEDAALEAALDRAGGFAILAAFSQPLSSQTAYSRPLPRFADLAEVASVDVPLSAGGVVRAYPYALTYEGKTLRSLAALLAGREGEPGTGFFIDYGIDLGRIDRVSVADLLAGTVDPARIANHQVVIGASAVELRDIFNTPRFGMVPGALLHIGAVETLLQGRALAPLGMLPVFGAMMLLALGLFALRERLARPAAIVSAIVGALAIEGLAAWLQVGPGKLLDTSPIHFTLFIFAVRAIAVEASVRRRLQIEAARERDGMRTILDRVIADNFDGIVVVEGSSVLAASRLAEETLGRDLVGRSLGELPEEVRAVLGRDGAADTGEFAMRTVTGEERFLEYTMTRSRIETDADSVVHDVACFTFRDVTERRRSQQRLAFLASHDPLTGALARHRLLESMRAWLGSPEGSAAGVTLAVLDLARFKPVNETLGHAWGDLLLRETVSRLETLGADCVARLGGDSFAVAVFRVLDKKERAAFAALLLERLVAPFEIEGHRAVIGANIGMTDSALSGADAELMLSHADMAQALAKQQVGNGLAVFSPEFDQRLTETRLMEMALRQALENNEVRVCYQPQLALDGDRLVGAEALVRWSHPQLGAVSPAKFIPVAEETGLIVVLGRWILETACREAVHWPDDIHVAVNVSPVQFELCDVVEMVREALAATGLAPHRLEIEITEGVLMSNSSGVIAVLERIRALGVGIALDDFGTGYSSLSYLGRLPVDKIKIDQSFVRQLAGEGDANAIVRAVVTLAHSLGKSVVAEGIETLDQLWILRAIGCETGQGYYFSRPMEADAFRAGFIDVQAREPVAV